MTARSTPRPELQAALDEVQRALEVAQTEAGPFDWNDKDWSRRNAAALLKCGADLTDRLDAGIIWNGVGARVRIAGVTATGTAGLSGALQNWMNAARRKLEAAQ